MNPRDILWAGPLPRAPRRGEELVVMTSASGARRIEIRPADSGNVTPVSLPVGAPLLGRHAARPYGHEGRSSFATENSSLVITCGAGAKSAGVVLSFPSSRLPRGADVRLVATHHGDGFGLAATLAGTDAKLSTTLPTSLRSRKTEVVIGPGAADAPAVQFVVQCPATAGRLVLEDLRLEPARQPVASPPLTAWAWEPTRWRTSPDELIDAAAARGVDRLYVALEIERGRVLHAPALARFVRLASDRGIAIDAVEGDPHMVRETGRVLALARARAIAAYQRQVTPSGRLAGIQYDIEPYLLPEFGADRTAVLAAWSGVLNDLAVALGTDIDVVVPFWLITEAGGEEALNAVADRLRQLTVMSYRTDPSLVTMLSEPVLAWGRKRGVPVRVALEMGPLEDETEQRFAPAPGGSLLVVEVEGDAVALLMNGAKQVQDAVTLGAIRPATVVRAANQSFLGNEAQLRRVAEDLERRLSAWPSFAGLALHGLL